MSPRHNDGSHSLNQPVRSVQLAEASRDVAAETGGTGRLARSRLLVFPVDGIDLVPPPGWVTEPVPAASDPMDSLHDEGAHSVGEQTRGHAFTVGGEGRPVPGSTLSSRW